MKIHIKNGRLIDPKNGIDGRHDLYIAAGRIAGVGRAPEGFSASRVIDAAGMVVCPGLVDLSARLREPGFEYKATLESEMAAAVAGGVTSLVCPPDTDPVLDEPGLVEMLKHRARSLNQAHVYPLGALTPGLAGKALTEMAELAEAGCIAFSQANVPVVDTEVLLHALQYAATFDFSVWMQPQDAHLGRDGIAHEGEVATRLGLAGIPVAAETIAIGTLLTLAESTGVRLHLRRLSSTAGLAMVEEARRRGIAVSCDVSINQIHLSEHDIGYFDSQCRLEPPLRAREDRDALRRGLASGAIQALCSDHTPVDEDGKQLPFGEAEPGATGLELLLPLTLQWAAEMKTPLATALSRITADAAAVAGIDGGHLGLGAAADVCVFDPEARWRLTPQALVSQGKNTPFLGREISGRVRWTLVDGQVVYDASARA